MAGRIGVFLSDDEGCIAEIATVTALASRKAEVKNFADRIAKLGFGLEDPCWSRLVVEHPELEFARRRLCSIVQDRVIVASMARLAA